MNNASFHLNLLKETEHRTSSPIRMKVFVPTLAFLAVVGTLLWWGSLWTKQMMLKTRVDNMKAANESRKAVEETAVNAHRRYMELSAELEQLDGYAASVRRIGADLAALAANMPANIQLISLGIAEPPPQDLKNPNPKLPPFRGPTNTVERQTFVIDGRAALATHAQAFKQRLALKSLAETLTNETSRIDTTSGGGESRATLFHFEYAMPARSFTKPKEGAK